VVIPGLIIVFACVLGGFMMAGGKPLALVQPAEFITIGGMAFGAMVVSTPMKILKRCFSKALGSLKGSNFSRQAYNDLLVMMFRLFSLARKNGLLALEPHISEPAKSDIIGKFPSVLHNKAALDLFTESMRLIVDGSVQPEELDTLMEESISTFEAEGHMPVNVLRAVADGLPGIGIVGAVLGIIITMGKIDGKPEEVGHHVACALVGTFLGVFLAYGILNPVVSIIVQQETEEAKYLNVIRASVKAYVSGASPSAAVEFGRQAIFSFDKPSAAEIEAGCKKAA
jgi:chemotaxis protein MotA